MSKYTYPLPLRWADADSHGHVNNALFLRYMEEARTRMFQDILPTDEAGRRRHAYVVSQSLGGLPCSVALPRSATAYLGGRVGLLRPVPLHRRVTARPS